MNQLSFLQSLGWSLINSLWQMALLWAIYQFIVVSFQKLKATHKTSLAILLTFSGFAWFIYTLVSSLFTNDNSIISFYNSGVINDNYWNYFAGKVLPWASVIYLFVLAGPLWQFIRNYRFVEFIRTHGLKKMDVAWRIYVKKTAAAMGITREVKIWFSEWVTSPVTIGYLKPIILIPVAAVNNLTPHQVEAVILHELSHIHRYDYFLNLILSFIRTVLYFNPFVKLLVKSIEKEREHSCDEMVLQFQYKPGEYASALLRLEQNKHRQMLMAAAGKNADLLHRIESILGMRNKGWNPLRQLSVALLTMAGIVLFQFLVSVKNDNGVKRSFYTLSNELSPYYFLTGKQVIADNLVSKNYNETSLAKQHKPVTKLDEINEDITLVDEAIAPGFMHVNYTTPLIPELAPEEEIKVKEAVNAAKKILKETEWKALEKTYADVFNSVEKIQLRTEYMQKEEEKIDWNKLEEQLRLAYAQINWENVNEKINTSLAQIKLDSIQHHLSVNVKQLSDLEKLMKENNVTAIPDTEICLQVVQENQQKAKDQLKILRAARTKKIVRL